MPTFRFRSVALVLAAMGACSRISQALIITNGYSPAEDDRFSAGYAAVPAANTSGSFLAAGFDLSGVGWNLSDPTQSAALLSPRNLLEAAHYSMPLNATGVQTATLGFVAANSTVVTTNYVQSVTDFSGSDMVVGTLGYSMPSTIHVFSILDTGPGANYDNDPLLLYGHGTSSPLSSPRVGRNVLAGEISGSLGNQAYYTNDPTILNLASPESGDSQSPVFIPWTNPVTAQAELTIIGAQYSTAGSSFLPDPTRYQAINAAMAASGYALLWTPAAINSTWVPATNNWGTAGNWSGGLPASGSYILFDPATAVAASSRSVNLAADRSVLGVYFNAGTPGATFTLGAGSVLTLGRGGLVNYASAAQTINCAVVLSDSQNWLAGSGGLAIGGTVINNGYLLSINTVGNSIVSGLITGTGGLAKDGAGMLTISTSQLYTGTTFVHAGVLNVTHPSGLAAGNVSLDGGATVRFSQPSAQAATITSLSMAAGSTLDINSSVAIYSASATARDALVSQLKAAVIAGQAGGTWSGTGLTSSAAQSHDAAAGSDIYGVALVRNMDLSYPFNTTTHLFDGVAINNLYILAKYTYMGDTDLDGSITADDYLNLDDGYLMKKAPTWANGDFNYDGTINYLDYALIDNACRAQSGTLAEPEIALHTAEFGQAYANALAALDPAAVPEPGALGMMVLAAPFLLARRRR